MSPELGEIDDVVLAERAQQGDHRAFAELLRRHRGAMHRTALRRTLNAADADDVVQDSSLKAWQSLDCLREPARIRSWLLQIADRRALTLVVRRRQEHELDEASAMVAGPDLGVDRLDLQDGTRAALEGMPPMQAHAWLLREVDELSYRQIAERLGTSESTVRGWLVLARRRVQRSIEQCCPDARHPAAAALKTLGKAGETATTRPAAAAASLRSGGTPPVVRLRSSSRQRSISAPESAAPLA